jgi:hypothetical protein
MLGGGELISERGQYFFGQKCRALQLLIVQWPGVICWLYTMVTLAVYTLLSDTYEDQQRNLPLYDLGRTALGVDNL